MNGVRLVQFETTQAFRDSLYHYPRSHRFGLGCGRIIIKGGDRVEETAPQTNKWNKGPPKEQRNKMNLSQSATSDVLNNTSDSIMDEAEKCTRKNRAGRNAGAGEGRGTGDKLSLIHI